MTIREDILELSGKSINEEMDYEQLKDACELETLKRKNAEKQFSEFKNRLSHKLQHSYDTLEKAKKMKMTEDIGEVILNTLDDVFDVLKSAGVEFNK